MLNKTQAEARAAVAIAPISQVGRNDDLYSLAHAAYLARDKLNRLASELETEWRRMGRPRFFGNGR